MSKVGQWVFEMQEDAYDMTLPDFLHKYGTNQSAVWYEVQQSIEDMEDFMVMDDSV
tara:strand:+ start:1028 stop:1195 length:168 start_codon:yes stop_codon:yes gene_type:complete